jgi:gamma-glutamyltranspeptidase/glutathione hydrolase
MRKSVAFLLLVAFIATPLAAASRRPVAAKHGMVSSVSDLASKVGVDILRRGGNAVDAAVAVAFALAVVWPEAGNLGGGGFMLVRTADGKTEAIDYRETAPAAATPDMYLDAAGNVIPRRSTHGWLAVAIPGTVAGLAMAHERHGKLPWRELVAPAEQLARDGFIVSEHLADRASWPAHAERLDLFPETRRMFGKLHAGERLVQRDLANTLARIAKNRRDFYTGETARRLIAGMRANGGIITAADLAHYKPIIREPLRGTYRGYDVITTPPPSGGGVALIEMLNMLSAYDPSAIGWHSSQHIHTLVEIMRRAMADRAQYVADPAFADVPLARLTSMAHADARRRTIDPEHASEIGPGELPNESPNTTHFVVVDAQGGVVSNTFTLNDSFGSGAVAKGTGFILNDEMDDFTTKLRAPNAWGFVQGERNAIAPGKRPQSSMCPTIVMKDGRVAFALGSPGGPTIPTNILQVISNIIDFGMNVQEAIESPRVHHQWMPDLIAWEERSLPADVRERLAAMGHHFVDHPGTPTTEGERFLGDVEVIAIDEDGIRRGGADPRRGGAARGY